MDEAVAKLPRQRMEDADVQFDAVMAQIAAEERRRIWKLLRSKLSKARPFFVREIPYCSRTNSLRRPRSSP